MDWFYSDKNSQQQGPVSDEEICRLIAQGIIDGNTRVWDKELPNWQKLSFSSLAPQLKLAPALPPPLNPLPPPYLAPAPAGDEVTKLQSRLGLFRKLHIALMVLSILIIVLQVTVVGFNAFSIGLFVVVLLITIRCRKYRTSLAEKLKAMGVHPS